jgi:hypothetical protein
MALAAVAYGAECRKQYSMNFSAMADVGEEKRSAFWHR